MNLAQAQAALFSLVTRDGQSRDDPERWVDGGSLAPAARVHIYAEMYVLRTRDALRDDYPHVAKLLGDDGYHAMVADYVEAFHSTHHSLARLGHALPQFLRERPPKGARADLADLAALEWARAEAFVERDSEVLDPASLQGIDPEAFSAAKLEMAPPVRRLVLQHDASAVWTALEHGEPVPEPMAGETHVVVWRRGFDVLHAVIPADESEALRRALAGEPVALCCEPFAERDDAAQAAFGAILSWLREGMVRRLA